MSDSQVQQPRRLKFLSDLELAAFLWRHMSPKFERRTLTLLKNTETIERMENAAKQSCEWRLCEREFRPLFENLLTEREEVRPSLLAALSPVQLQVCGEEEAGWMRETLGVAIEREERPSSIANLNKDLSCAVDILLCLVSSTVDQSDPFSATRLLASFCPETLPALRKRAADTNLNLVQALLSYSMTARIHAAGEDDAILAKHIDLLKRFDLAVDEMHERMHEYDDENRSISSMLTVATNFLLSTPVFANDVAKFRKAQQIVQSQLRDLISNQKTMDGIMKNANEDAPELVTRCDRVCRALLDRFTALEISGAAAEGISMTLVFKTPQLAKPATQETTEVEVECETPKRSEDDEKTSWFLCNSTPTPHVKRSDDSGIYEELLDEEKENIDPRKKAMELENENSENTGNKKSPLGESSTPVRSRPSSGGLRMRKSNENRTVLGEKKSAPNEKRRSKGADGDSKKSKPNPPGQQSIRAFFTRT